MDTSYFNDGDEEWAHVSSELRRVEAQNLPSFLYDHHEDQVYPSMEYIHAQTPNPHVQRQHPYNLRNSTEIRPNPQYAYNEPLFATRQPELTHPALRPAYPLFDFHEMDQHYGIRTPGHLSPLSGPYDTFNGHYPASTPRTMHLSTPHAAATPYAHATPFGQSRVLSGGSSLSNPHHPYGNLRWGSDN